MNCEQCNAVLPESAAFCGNCGGKVEQKYPEVSHNTTVDEPNQVPPPIPQAATVSPPQASPHNKHEGPQLIADESIKPVGVGTYLIMMLLFSIPFVNIIMMIIWAIGSKNKSKQNFAIAALLWFILAVILCFGLMAIAFILSLSANIFNGRERDVFNYLGLFQKMLN